MNLVRKYKISIINNEPLSGRDKDIIDFIEDKLSNLIPFKHDAYPNSTFYMKDDKLLLEHDVDTLYLYCRREDFWDELRYKYNMGYDDVQDIVKYMVEQIFKLRVDATSIYNIYHKQVEEYFKIKIKACLHFSTDFSTDVLEKAIKKKFKM